MEIIKLIRSLQFVQYNKSISKEYLKCFINEFSDIELEYLYDNAIFLYKNIYDIIYHEYARRLKLKSRLEQKIIIDKLPTKIRIANKYIEKIRIASFIDVLLAHDIEISKEVVAVILNDQYFSIRKIGYHCMFSRSYDCLIKLVIENHNKYEDDILDILLTYNLDSKTTQILTEYLDAFYEDEQLTFPEIIKRNKLLAKLSKFEKLRICALKDKDPLSYIFVTKNIKGQIESEYLVETFYSFNPRKWYLIKWYKELGNLEAIEIILKNELEEFQSGNTC